MVISFSVFFQVDMLEVSCCVKTHSACGYMSAGAAFNAETDMINGDNCAAEHAHTECEGGLIWVRAPFVPDKLISTYSGYEKSAQPIRFPFSFFFFFFLYCLEG